MRSHVLTLSRHYKLLNHIVTSRAYLPKHRISVNHHSFRLSSVKMQTDPKAEEAFKRLPLPVKGLCDRYKYSVIQLKNGLTALLVSDVENLITLDENVTADDKMSMEQESEESGNESGDETASSVDSQGMEVDEFEEADRSKQEKKSDEKLAALSLTIGVGSFCDGHIPGLAHFLEHMVFMGSEKYPEENDFDAFLSTRGGSSNASTEYETTTFYFDVPEPHLKKSMDIFSNFFISPLLKRDSIASEMDIVDSEFQSSILNDTCRLEQLLATACTKENPAGKFVWGNLETLKNTVDENELYAALRNLQKTHYVANHMTLALQARLDLPTLEAWVVEHFSGIPSNESPKKTFSVETPFELDWWNRFYTVKPVDDVNVLYMTWYTPPVQQLYKTKPLDVLSWLIGHEGPGSIVSYLRKKFLAIEIEAGYHESGFEYNHLYTLFQINVTLTDQGVDQIQHIMDIIFQYLRLLSQSPISSEMYAEISNIHHIGFNYHSTKSSVDYVEELSLHMQYFPSQEYITGPTLFEHYDSDLIRQFLGYFTPDRLNIALLSNIVCRQPGVHLDQTEPWFKTEYKVEPIPAAQISSWTNIELREPSLFLPSKNEFITTDFSLLPLANQIRYPERLLKTDQIEVWFKQTDRYKLPQCVIYYVLEIPHVKESVERVVLFDVYLNALNVTLQEETYAPYLAQLHATIARGEFGINMSLNGFNQHMGQFLSIVLSHMRTFQVPPQLFEVCKDTLLRNYVNNLKDMEVLRRALRMAVLVKESYMIEDKYRVLKEGVTYEQFVDFRRTLFDRMYVKCLSMGNITPDSVLSMTHHFTSTLPFTPLSQEERREIRVTRLEPRERIIRVRSFNQNDPNCTVLNYYQSSGIDGSGNAASEDAALRNSASENAVSASGNATALENAAVENSILTSENSATGNAASENSPSLREFCIVEILVEIISEPLFDTLRTKQKLGYYVGATVRDTFGVLGLSIVVESQVNKYSVDDIESRVHGFITGYLRENYDTVQSKYEDIIGMLVKKKSMTEVNLKEESDRYFEEIKLNDYLFDRQEREIEYIRSISLDEVVQWVDVNVVTKYKKLSIQIVGSGDEKPAEPAEGSAKPNHIKNDHKRKLSDSEDVSNLINSKQAIKIKDREANIKGNSNQLTNSIQGNSNQTTNTVSIANDIQQGSNQTELIVGNGTVTTPAKLDLESTLENELVNGLEDSRGLRRTKREGSDSRDLVMEYLVPNGDDRFVKDIKQYRRTLEVYPVIKLK